MFLALLTLAAAEDNWTTQSAEMVRWPGAAEGNPVVTTLDEGAKVEVLFRDGERVRVRANADLGWVDAAALTIESPQVPSLLDGIEID